MRTIRLFQPVQASPAELFRAVSEPSDLSAWQADEVRGRVESGRVIELSWPGLGISLSLEVAEVSPPFRIVFSHGSGRLELEPKDGGLELRHTAAFDEDSAAGTESSWRLALGTLSTYLECHAGRRRRVHWAVARAHAEPELCYAYFTEPVLLSSWLGRATPIGAPGTRTELGFANGRTASCSVLANTPGRDLALRWHEADDSVLILRTLPTPSRDGTRQILLGWSRWTEPPDAARIGQELDAAARRLGERLRGVARA